MCCRRGFGESVTLLDGDFKAGVHGFYELFCEGRGAGIHHADGGEVVVRYYGRLSEGQDHGGHDVGESYAVGLDVLAEFCEIEFGHDD